MVTRAVSRKGLGCEISRAEVEREEKGGQGEAGFTFW